MSVDKPGVVAHITRILSEEGVNIAFMRLFREEKGAAAYTIVESDEKIPQKVLGKIRENPLVLRYYYAGTALNTGTGGRTDGF